jgi:hypothetical protein
VILVSELLLANFGISWVLLMALRPIKKLLSLGVSGAGWPELGVNSILNMKVFLLAAAGSGNLANEHSLDLLIS